jgi:hypothetical protein
MLAPCLSAKKGAANCGGPSTREENAPPTMTVRSHSKASKPSGASLIEVKKLS